MRKSAAPPAAAALLLAAAAAAHSGAQAAPVFDCAGVGAAEAWARPHPGRPHLAAVLCRWDPFPGWSESLWIVDAAGDEPTALRVPLHGTGIESFRWLDCPGALAAHVVDATHMGTLTDRVVRIVAARVEVVDRARFRRGTGAVRSRAPCPGMMAR